MNVKYLFAILVLTGLLSACSAEFSTDKKEAEDQTEERREEAAPVEVVQVDRGRIESVIQSSANLETEQNVKVYGRTSNPVIEMLVEEGDKVAKGDVLLRLLDDTQQIEVAKARSRVEKARKDFERQNELFRQNLITQQEINDADYEVEQAKLAFDEAERNLEYTVVEAPIAGTVTQRYVKLGDQVNVNQELFEIVDFNTMVALVYLPEKNLANLAVGQPARLVAPAVRQSNDGEVLRIAPTVDAGTGTVKVTVKVNEIAALRPGMFVDIELVLDVHENAVLIPKRALIYDSDQLYVYRLPNGADRVERVLIQPVLQDENFVEPGAEIGAGDRIVIAGQTGLKNQALVRVVNDDAPAPTEPAQEEIEADADAEETVAAKGSRQ